MSLRAFHQYIDMYVAEHPQTDDQTIKRGIAKAKTQGKDCPMVTSDLIFKSDENIIVSCHPFAANGHIVKHSHNYFELIYLARGNCDQMIDQTPCNLKEGDMVILSPNAKHSVNISSPKDLLFNIIIKPSLFRESFFCLIAENDMMSHFFLTSLFTMSEKNHFLYFPRHTNCAGAAHIQALIREYYEKDLCYKKSLECYLALLFSELLRSYRHKIDEENYEAMGNQALSSILSYMNLHKNEATLSSVAEEFHYHPNYLSGLIKKYTNKSFSEIIQEGKMQEACYYLKHTDMPIDDIVQLMNYYDRSYFNRVFKKTFGMTPGEYKKR